MGRPEGRPKVLRTFAQRGAFSFSTRVPKALQPLFDRACVVACRPDRLPFMGAQLFRPGRF